MADEERIEESTAEDTSAQYIAAIKELKENSVDRATYQKL